MTNSKQGADNASPGPGQDGKAAAAGRFVLATALALALLILGSTLQLPASLSGRLNPALVPAALALLILGAAVFCILARPPMEHSVACDGEPEAPASATTIFGAILAIVILALGVRTAGLMPTVAVAGMTAALSVPGTTLLRAIVVGILLAAGAAGVFVLGLRQPLPLWPNVQALGL